MLKKIAIISTFLASLSGFANEDSGTSVFLYDASGFGVTSNFFSGTRNPLDVETVFGGSIVDPRARTWTLGSSTDLVGSVQSGTWTVQQGATPTTLANAWPVKPTDGTTSITVKAASVDPVLTDTAEVVTERPDNIGTITQTSVSCGATSTTLLAAGTATMFLSIRNPTTSTNTVWIQFNGSAATAAVPSIDLAPGAEWDGFAFGTSFLPSSQFNCISGGTASSVALVYK